MRMEHELYESGNGNIKLGRLPGVSGGELTTSVMFNEILSKQLINMQAYILKIILSKELFKEVSYYSKWRLMKKVMPSQVAENK